MANCRAKSKVEIGGYFDDELVAHVRAAAAARGITLTQFVTEAYQAGLDRDRPTAAPAAKPAQTKRHAQRPRGR